MGLFSRGPKINDPYGTQGGQSVQRQAAAAGNRGGDQVDRLLQMRRDMDSGTVTEGQLIAEVRRSKIWQVNEAMDEFGGIDAWNGRRR